MNAATNEVMFVDNKDYEQPVRGGKQIAFVLYDLRTTGKSKVDSESNADNGYSFRRIETMECGVIMSGCINDFQYVTMFRRHRCYYAARFPAALDNGANGKTTRAQNMNWCYFAVLKLDTSSPAQIRRRR